MNQRKGDVINLKRRHKSFMNKPKTGINAPGQVSFQRDGMDEGLADGLRDGLADGLRDGLADGLRDGLADGFVVGLGVGGGAATVAGHAVAGSAVLVRQQQKRLTPDVAGPQSVPT
jgi:hypothetical protein